MNKLVFYKCPVCGNLAVMIQHPGLNPLCCTEPMKALLPKQQTGAVGIKNEAFPQLMAETHSISRSVRLTGGERNARARRSSELPSLRINEVPEGWEEAFCPICEKTA